MCYNQILGCSFNMKFALKFLVTVESNPRQFALRPVEGSTTPAPLLICCRFTEEGGWCATARHHHACCCDYGGKL